MKRGRLKERRKLGLGKHDYYDLRPPLADDVMSNNDIQIEMSFI